MGFHLKISVSKSQSFVCIVKRTNGFSWPLQYLHSGPCEPILPIKKNTCKDYLCLTLWELKTNGRFHETSNVAYATSCCVNCATFFCQTTLTLQDLRNIL